MNANQLYNNISVLLYNILKVPELRSEMVMSIDFRKSLIIQVNQLLGLEKDFDSSLNNEKLSLTFAQIIVNELNTEEQIEKPDNSILQDFENSFKEVIEYIDTTFPKLLFSANLNFNEVINTKMILGLPEFIKNQNEKIAESKKNSSINQITDQDMQSNENSQTVNNQNSNSNSNQDDSFTSYGNNSNSNNVQSNMQDLSKMPFNTPNPILDPRFYPYKTKPKAMPYLKKISFIFYILITALVLFIFYYSNAYLGIHIFSDTKLNRIIVSKNFDSGVHFSTGKSSSTPNDVFATVSMFSSIIIPVLFIVVTVFLGFSVFSQRNVRREKYHVSPLTAYLSVILLAVSIYFFIQFAVSGLFKDFIEANYNGLNWIDNGKDGLPTLISQLENSTPFKVVNYASIALTVFAVIEFVVLVLIIIYNPRIDREKLQLANTEYQKLITSKIRGEYYKVDPKLFDEDEDETNNNKHKKDAKHNKKDNK